MVPNTNTVFSWYAAVDPDTGDYIQLYDFQADNDPAFGSPEIDGALAMSGPVPPLPFVTVSTPLSGFAGTQNLQPGLHYYWRVRAEDGHGMFGPWSTEPWYFVLAGEVAPVRATITAFQRVSGTNWLIQWSGPTNNVYLEATPLLNAVPTWSTFAGPLSGSSFTIIAPTNWPTSFYRLRSQ